ncbi:MAG: hypothetical protein ACOCRU_02265 [bacterium]
MDLICQRCGNKFNISRATKKMIKNGICFRCVRRYYVCLFGSRRRISVADFVKHEDDIKEIIEILEEIDLEIEAAELESLYIEKLFLGKNIHDKLVKANDFFIHGIVNNELKDKILTEYRGIPVEIMDNEGDLDDIDFMLGE